MRQGVVNAFSIPSQGKKLYVIVIVFIKNGHLSAQYLKMPIKLAIRGLSKNWVEEVGTCQSIPQRLPHWVSTISENNQIVQKLAAQFHLSSTGASVIQT